MVRDYKVIVKVCLCAYSEDPAGGIMKNYKRSIYIIIALIFIFSACNISSPSQSAANQTETVGITPSKVITPITTTSPTIDGVAVYSQPFAEYKPISVKLPDKSAFDYTLPIDLTKVNGLETLGLSEEQLHLLSVNGFVVSTPIPKQYQEFYQLYESIRYQENQTTFASTDAVFHIYHLIFDKMLRDLERDYFLSDIKTLTASLLKTTIDQYNALLGTPLEDPALRNVAYIGVASYLLGLNLTIPDEALSMVESEISLIESHNGANVSPIWDRPDLPEDQRLIEDYGQYIPRGHYTQSDELKQYFKVMMWYGRMTFRLRDIPETQRALLLVRAVRKTENAEVLWSHIYDPTVFIVGKSDDHSFSEYGVLSDSIFGPESELINFNNDTLITQFVNEARDLPAPQINSMWVWIWEDRNEATQGFRFMGQRFTLDEYVFGQLMWRKVGTIDNPRDLPKALDLFAAMGSEEAYNILDSLGEPNYENYSDQLNKVRSEISSLEIDSWTQNLYWNWLFSFYPLIESKDETFPAFMRTQAWAKKELNTALGSYTELKHDTILYAKQVMAEMGGGMGENPPKGYIEPNPEIYARLHALAQMTYDGLLSRGLLNTNTKNNLENLMDLLGFMQTISEKELNGESITDEEYWRIMYFGGELEALTLAAADTTEEYDRDLSDQKAALVADIATGIGRVLEEAIGQPAIIYVIPPDDPTRVSIGAVYTYYEFSVSTDQRMTDEAWQGLVESGQTPANPSWTSSFMVP
jgi:hypothetical protein